MSNITTGQTVNVHYVGTFDDGSVFDSSRERGQSISFTAGQGELIPGFDNQILEMKVGETKSFSLGPEDGYGVKNPDAVQEIPKANFPEDMNLQEGATVTGMGPTGPVNAVVHSFDETTVTLDFNHPMAGKNLNFEVEVLSAE